MFTNLKDTLKNPDFQRSVALGTGKVVGVIASMVISGLVNKGIEVGINKVMDKVQNVETTTAIE